MALTERDYTVEELRGHGCFKIVQGSAIAARGVTERRVRRLERL
jgi:hypothetical protein